LVYNKFGGLNYLDEKRGLKIVPYEHNDEITKISKDYITTIIQFSNEVFYFGTMGSGFLEYNIKTHNIKLFNKKNGLPNNVVYGLLKDDNKNLWLSTNKGISKFNTYNKTFENYTELDGLVSTEFNQGAYFKTQKGDFYFGAINGLNYFDPLIFDNQKKKTNVVFTKFKLDAQWIKPNLESGVLISKYCSNKKNRFEL
jgi:ligand-binding sensor domain-containing protein